MNKNHRVKSSIRAIKIDMEVVFLFVIIFILYMFYMPLMYSADSGSSDYKDKFPTFGQEDEAVEK